MNKVGPNEWGPLAPFLGHHALVVSQDCDNKCQEEADLCRNLQFLKIFLDTGSIVYLAQERERGRDANEIGFHFSSNRHKSGLVCVAILVFLFCKEFLTLK